MKYKFVILLSLILTNGYIHGDGFGSGLFGGFVGGTVAGLMTRGPRNKHTREIIYVDEDGNEIEPPRRHRRRN